MFEHSLKEGECHRVIITHANINEAGQLLVWCELDNDPLDQLLQLEEILQECAETQPCTPLEKGKLCCCKFVGDNRWYRACAKRQLENGKWAVHFIDYGNTQVLEEKSCYSLPEELSKLPKQALSFTLDFSVHPLNSSALWTPAVSKTILQSLLYDTVTINVIKACEGGLSVCDCTAITDILLEDGFIEQVNPGFSYPYNKFKIGETLPAFVSHVAEQGNFFIQRSNSMADLKKVMNEMALYYARPSNRLLLPRNAIEVGTLAAAVCSSDQGYYRAQIISVRDDSCVVRFIDYGDTQTETFESIFVLHKQFCKLEFQSVECKINDIEIFSDKCTSSLKKTLKDLLFDQTVNVTIRGHCFETHTRLSVTGICESSNLTISAFLVAEGYAKYSPSAFAIPASNLEYKYPLIKLGSEYKANLTQVGINQLFYVSFFKDAPKLLELAEALTCYCNSSDAQMVDKVWPGKLCCAMHTDAQWCRAQVKAVDGNIAQVFHVDYGRLDECSLSFLREIKEQFVELNCQAVCCHVLKQLSTQAITQMQGLLNETFLVKFLLKEEHENLYVVKLRYKENTLFLSELKDLPVHIITSKNEVNDAQRIVLENSNDGNCWNNMLTIDSSLCCSLGKFVDVHVCFVQDPECMWIQLVSQEMQLFDLLLGMESFYNNNANKNLMIESPMMNGLCSIRLKKGNKWYRGRIMFSYADVVEVKLIDFGNEVKANLDEIRVLAPQFCKVKAQALKCKLFNIKPAFGQWTTDCIRDILKLTQAGENVSGKFIEKQCLSYVVELTVKDCAGKKTNIAELLVEKSYGIWLNKSLAPIKADVEKEVTLLPDVENVKTLNSKRKLLYRSTGMAMIGTEIEVSVCNKITSLASFFLKIRHKTYQILYEDLFKRLDDWYSKDHDNEDLSVDKNELFLGMPCVFFYEKVHHWCRATVLQFSNVDSILLCLVDYGQILKVNLKTLKSINNDFILETSPAAMRCTMSGLIKPIGASWLVQALDLCQELVEKNSHRLTGIIHGCATDLYGMVYVCSLRTPFINVAQELIKHGVVKKVEAIGQEEMHPFKLKSFFYSTLGVTKGMESMFYITHVENSQLFFCQLSENFHEHNSMMKELQTHCMERRDEAASIDDLVQNCICFVRYDEDQWYRAHFLAAISDQKVKVLFVDYGNIDIVNLKDVLTFREDSFINLPIQAIPCSLTDLNTSSTDTVLENKLVDLMNNILLEKTFPGVVTGSDNGKCLLDLYDSGSRINDFIAKQAGCNVLLDNYGSSTNVDAPVDAEVSIMETDLIDPVFLKVGVQESVTISHIASPTCFNIEFPHLVKEKEEFNQVINSCYTPQRMSDNSLFSLRLGEMVCIYCEDMDQWKRACVRKIATCKDDQVEIQFIDTGKVGRIRKFCNVKRLISEMCKWSKFSVSCSLVGLKHNSGMDWSDEAVSYFCSLVKSEGLRAKFLCKDLTTGSWLVDIRLNETNLSSMLVCEGHAMFDECECEKFNICCDKPADMIPCKPKLWNGEKEVVVSYIASHKEVYIQPVDCLPLLHAVMVKINTDKHMQPFNNVPKVGMCCLAYYKEDGQFYRAKVIKTVSSDCEDENFFNISYIDYGNTSTISMSEARKMKKLYASFPEAAIRCILNMTTKNNDGIETKERLEDFSLSDDFRFFASFHKENCILQIQKTNGEKMPLEDVLSCYVQSSVALNTNSPNETVKRPPMLTYTRINNVLDRANKNVYVCHIVNPGDVYCHFSEEIEEFDKLMHKVALYCKGDGEEAIVTSTSTLALGSACIAEHSTGGWYRGVVERIVSDNKLEIRFVDYGDSEEVSLEKIRISKDEFCVLPMQALHCFLLHVDNDPTSWNFDHIHAFDNEVAELELSSTFHSSFLKEGEVVYVITLCTPDGTMINEKLSKISNLCDSTSHAKEEKIFEVQENVKKISKDKSEKCKAVTAVIKPTLSNIRKEDSLKPYAPDIEITADCVEEAYVCYVEDLHNFFVHLKKTKDQLESIATLIQSDVETAQTRQLHNYVIAKSPDDNMWYRGELMKKGNQATIYFIDYGNTCQVDWDYVKNIGVATSDIAKQAIACSLNISAELPEDVGQRVIDTFLYDKLLHVKFLKKQLGGKWKVSIEVDGVDVTEKIWEFVNVDKMGIDWSGVPTYKRKSFDNERYNSAIPSHGSTLAAGDSTKSSTISVPLKLCDELNANTSIEMFLDPPSTSTSLIVNTCTDAGGNPPIIKQWSPDFLSGLDKATDCAKPIESTGDLVDYFKSFCNEIRSCLLDKMPTEIIFKQLDAMKIHLDTIRIKSSTLLKKISRSGGSGDAAVLKVDVSSTSSVDSATSTCNKSESVNEFVSAETDAPMLSGVDTDESENTRYLPKLVLIPATYYARVTCCENPASFYVTPRVDIELPELLKTTKLISLSTNSDLSLCVFYPKGNDAVIRRPTRGVVLSHDDEIYIVLDIDTGEKYWLALDKLFEMPDELRAYPPLAVHCSLHGVFPVEEDWSVEACKFFCDEMCSGNDDEDILVKFDIELSHEGDLSQWSVKVFTKVGGLINSLLIDQKYATDTVNSKCCSHYLNKENVLPVEENKTTVTGVIRLPFVDVTKFTPAKNTSATNLSSVGSSQICLDSIYLQPSLQSEYRSSGSAMSDSVFASNGRNINSPTGLSWNIYHSSSNTPAVERVSLLEIEGRSSLDTNVEKSEDEQTGSSEATFLNECMMIVDVFGNASKAKKLEEITSIFSPTLQEKENLLKISSDETTDDAHKSCDAFSGSMNVELTDVVSDVSKAGKQANETEMLGDRSHDNSHVEVIDPSLKAEDIKCTQVSSGKNNKNKFGDQMLVSESNMMRQDESSSLRDLKEDDPKDSPLLEESNSTDAGDEINTEENVASDNCNKTEDDVTYERKRKSHSSHKAPITNLPFFAAKNQILLDVNQDVSDALDSEFISHDTENNDYVSYEAQDKDLALHETAGNDYALPERHFDKELSHETEDTDCLSLEVQDGSHISHDAQDESSSLRDFGEDDPKGGSLEESNSADVGNEINTEETVVGDNCNKIEDDVTYERKQKSHSSHEAPITNLPFFAVKNQILLDISQDMSETENNEFLSLVAHVDNNEYVSYEAQDKDHALRETAGNGYTLPERHFDKELSHETEDTDCLSLEVQDSSHISHEVQDDIHISYEAQDDSHTSYAAQDDSHTLHEVQDGSHTSYEAQDDSHTSHETQDGSHTSYAAQDDSHTLHEAQNDSHTSHETQNGSHTSYETQDDSHTSHAAQDDSYTLHEVQDDSHTSQKVQDSSQTSHDPQDGSHTSYETQDDSHTSQEVQDGSQTSHDPQDGSHTSHDAQNESSSLRDLEKVDPKGSSLLEESNSADVGDEINTEENVVGDNCNKIEDDVTYERKQKSHSSHEAPITNLPFFAVKNQILLDISQDMSETENNEFLSLVAHVDNNEYVSYEAQDKDHALHETAGNGYTLPERHFDKELSHETEDTDCLSLEVQDGSHISHETQDDSHTSYAAQDDSHTLHEVQDGSHTSYAAQNDSHTSHETQNSSHTSYEAQNDSHTSHETQDDSHTSHAAQDDSYTLHEVQDDSHTSQEVQDSSQTSHDPQDGSHTSYETQDGSHTSQKVRDDSYTSQEVHDDSYTSHKAQDTDYISLNSENSDVIYEKMSELYVIEVASSTSSTISGNQESVVINEGESDDGLHEMNEDERDEMKKEVTSFQISGEVHILEKDELVSMDLTTILPTVAGDDIVDEELDKRSEQNDSNSIKGFMFSESNMLTTSQEEISSCSSAYKSVSRGSSPQSVDIGPSLYSTPNEEAPGGNLPCLDTERLEKIVENLFFDDVASSASGDDVINCGSLGSKEK